MFNSLESHHVGVPPSVKQSGEQLQEQLSEVYSAAKVSALRNGGYSTEQVELQRVPDPLLAQIPHAATTPPQGALRQAMGKYSARSSRTEDTEEEKKACQRAAILTALPEMREDALLMRATGIVHMPSDVESRATAEPVHTSENSVGRFNAVGQESHDELLLCRVQQSEHRYSQRAGDDEMWAVGHDNREASQRERKQQGLSEQRHTDIPRRGYHDDLRGQWRTISYHGDGEESYQHPGYGDQLTHYDNRRQEHRRVYDDQRDHRQGHSQRHEEETVHVRETRETERLRANSRLQGGPSGESRETLERSQEKSRERLGRSQGKVDTRSSAQKSESKLDHPMDGHDHRNTSPANERGAAMLARASKLMGLDLPQDGRMTLRPPPGGSGRAGRARGSN